MSRWMILSCFSVVFFARGIARGQISCLDYGQAVYCSNGLSAVRSGNTLYFSDGTTAQTLGNIVTINGLPTEVSRSDAADATAGSYAMGQAIGTMVGAVFADVRHRRKFYQICGVDPYARGWLNGMLAFCSQEAILDACSNVPKFDFSGFKYAGDTPHHLSWDTAGKLQYLPNWPRLDGEVECVPDIAAHSTHEARLWLAYKREVETALVGLHPHLSQNDCARIVNYILAHPDAYDARKVYKGLAAEMFQKIYIAVKANS
jgi:hypothetical protein